MKLILSYKTNTKITAKNIILSFTAWTDNGFWFQVSQVFFLSGLTVYLYQNIFNKENNYTKLPINAIKDVEITSNHLVVQNMCPTVET